MTRSLLVFFRGIGLMAMLMALLCWCVPAWADHAPDHVANRAYWLDPSGALTIDQVQDKAFQPMPEVLSVGASEASIWIRIDLLRRNMRNQVLVVEPSSLEDVRMYVPAPAGWQEIRSGSGIPFAERVRTESHVAIAVPDPIPADGMRLYVRVRSVHNIYLKAQVMDASESQRLDVNRHTTVAMGAGVLATLLMLSLLQWFGSRDSQWLIGAGTLLSGLIIVTGVSGLLDRVLFPDAPRLADTLKTVARVLYTGLMYLYFLRLYKWYRAPGWAVLPMQVYLVLSPFLLIGIVSGHTRKAMLVHLILMLINSLAGVVTIWFLRIRDRVLQATLVSLSLLLSLLTAYLVLSWMGVFPPTEFNRSALYASVTLCLLLGATQYFIQLRRDRVAHLAGLQARVEAERAQEALQQEHARRQEMDGLLGMLLHELKNPLAAIRMGTEMLARDVVEPTLRSEARFARIHQSIDVMVSILDKVRQTDLLSVLKVHREDCDVRQLLEGLVRTSSAPARVRLTMDISGSLQLDVRLLTMMCSNLLENALAYSDRGSQVVVQAGEESVSNGGQEGVRHLVVRFRNSVAPGALPDEQQLFRKYYRGNAAQHRSGTGLGLYWVRQVATAMGGGVQYRAEECTVEFALSLPA